MEKKGVTKKITKQVPKKTVKVDTSKTRVISKTIKKTQVRKIKDFRVHIEELEASKGKMLKKVKAEVKFDKTQVKKATEILKEFYGKNKKKTELLESDDGFIYVEVVLNKLPEEYSMRPAQMYIKFY